MSPPTRLFLLLAAGCTGTDKDTGPAETAPAETAPAETASDETTNDSPPDSPIDSDSPADSDTAAPDADADGHDASTDCDDHDATVHPGASDPCDDGVDQDCDGDSEACLPSGAAAVADLAATTWVSNAELCFGHAVGAGDINGDGTPDMLAADLAEGMVQAYFGPFAGGVRDAALADVTWTFSGSWAWNDPWVPALTTLDYNGDGVADLAYGHANTLDDAEAVYVCLGSGTLAGARTEADCVLRVDGVATPTNLGDLDGDGDDELGVGLWDVGGAVFAGGSTGVLTAADGDIVFQPEPDRADQFGMSVVSLGDLDGDGVVDLGVTDGWDSTATAGSGALFVFSGPVAGTLTAADADAVLYGIGTDGLFGDDAGPLGDVNGDGYDDLLVSAPAAGAGVVYVVYGPLPHAPRLVSDLRATALDVPEPGYTLRVDPAGDLDGDGYADLVVSAPQADDEVGRAWIVFGPLPEGDVRVEDVAWLTLEGGTPGGHLGWDLAAGVDVDLDGATDVLLGEAGEEEYCGYRLDVPPRVHLVRGGGRNAPVHDPPVVDLGDDADGDGWSEDAGDCLDVDAAVFPGAEERCGNGLDDDCDGADAACAPVDVAPLQAPFVTWFLAISDARREGAAVAVGDFDGDGAADLVNGAPWSTSGRTTNGRVDLYLGPFAPRSPWCSPTCSDDGARTEQSVGEVGTALAVLDDDGDGVADLWVGAPGASTSRVYLLRGDAGGFPDLLEEGPTTLSAEADDDALGDTLVALGDLDGDGLDELAVGAPGVDDPADGAGAVYLFASPVAAGAVTASAADTVCRAASASAGMSAVAPAGDLDSDGLGDLIAGAPGAGDGGEAYAWRGGTFSAGCAPDTAAVTFLGSAGSALGSSVAGLAADVTGDGEVDVVLGAPLDDTAATDAGAAWVYSGASAGTWASSDAYVGLLGEDAGARAGTAVVALADLDANGIPELAIGAPGDAEGGVDAGAVYLWYDLFAATGEVSLATADAKRTGAASAAAGAPAALDSGDMNGDGFGDLVVGSEVLAETWILYGGVGPR